ncbi:MAG: F0F1 ATP synthase subunit B [Actinomycetota bacterium]|nr:F0F1 ATP synthase subunit B [Actinomycetota bacterium]
MAFHPPAQAPIAAKNFLIPNATFIAEIVAFLIVVVIIAKYIYPYIQKPLRERQEIIKQQIEDAEKAREKLAEAESAYQRALVEARTEAAQIRENARAEAQRTVEELRQQAQEESARIVARGDEQLARQRGAVVRELRAEIGTLAVELSEKIVDQRLADDTQVRATVDAFIAGLEATDSAGAGAQS